MTDIAVCSDVPYKDEDSWNDFRFQNYLAHVTYSSLLGAGYDTGLASLLSPSHDDFLEIHQLIHQNEFAALNIEGLPDLSSLDIEDRSQWFNWLLLHQVAHRQTDNALNL